MLYLQTIHGYKHMEVARCQREMAHIFKLQGDSASAKQAISKARKIVAETCGKTSLEYADFLKSEAGLLRDLAKQGITVAARVLLNCPFADKDAAKALGARWDAGLKKWCIEAGTPLAPFAAWLPADAKSTLAGYDQKQAKLCRDSAAAYREAVAKQRQLVGERHPILLATYDDYMGLILEQQKVLLVQDIVDEVAMPRVMLELCINGTLKGKRAFDFLEALEALHAKNRSRTEVTVNDPSQMQAQVLERWKTEMQGLMMESGLASLLISDPEQSFFLFGDATAGLEILDARKERQVCGRTALMWASAMGISSVVPKLLRLGDKPEHMGEDKKTALMIAIENKHEEVVQLLIEPTAAAGAIDAQDTEGNSALMLATLGSHSRIMGKLLEVGATVSSAVLIAMIKPETAALALNLIQDETLRIDYNVATLLNENLSQNHRPIELLMASDDDTCMKLVELITISVGGHVPGFELKVCMYGLKWKNRPFMCASDNPPGLLNFASDHYGNTEYYRKTIIESNNVLKQNCQPTGQGRWVEENVFAMRNYGSGTWIARFSDQVVLTGWLRGQLSDDQVRDSILVAREEWMEEEVDLTKDLPDSAFSSSGHSDENHAPHFARLNGPKCWCPKRQGGDGQWLQIDLGSAVVVCAFAVQGRFFDWASTLDFQVSATGEESAWESLGSFEANSDADSVVRTELPKPARVRFVRFYPLECVGGHAGVGKMRVSVFGNKPSQIFSAEIYAEIDGQQKKIEFDYNVDADDPKEVANDLVQQLYPSVSEEKHEEINTLKKHLETSIKQAVLRGRKAEPPGIQIQGAPAAARMCYEMFSMPHWRTRPENKITFGVSYDLPPSASTALTLNYWAQYTGSGGGRCWCGFVAAIATGKFARMSCYIKLEKMLSSWGKGIGGLSWGFKFQDTFRNEFTIHHSTVNTLTANTWMYISATAPTTLNGDRNHFLLIFDSILEPITIQFGGVALEIFESKADADAAPLPYGPDHLPP
jgi:hypothetical protein